MGYGTLFMLFYLRMYCWPLHKPQSAPGSFSQAIEPPTRHPSSDLSLHDRSLLLFHQDAPCFVYLCVCVCAAGQFWDGNYKMNLRQSSNADMKLC